ncbi:unnamed protein product, partial [Amoebophrya sp. A120]
GAHCERSKSERRSAITPAAQQSRRNRRGRSAPTLVGHVHSKAMHLHPAMSERTSPPPKLASARLSKLGQVETEAP